MDALNHIRELLSVNGDVERAKKMEAYLRNQFSFFGVMSGPRKLLLKQCKTLHLNHLNPKDKRTLVGLLWKEPEREYQLLALEWLMQWSPKDYLESDIRFFEELILQKSWWDTVDGIAPNLVGKYAKRFPDIMKNTLVQWESHDSFWIRRSCLIHQLRYRKDTDLTLLLHFVQKFKLEKQFFIQKAIGWSLREVAKFNPSWVIEVVEGENLSGLARREALKHIL